MSYLTTRGLAPEISGANRWQLWFGLLGAALAWLAHLILAYVIAEFGCGSEWGHQLWHGISLIAWLVVGATLLTLSVALVGVLVAYRSPNVTDNDLAVTESWQEAKTIGLMASSLFAIAIVFESIPIIYYLRSC